MEKLRKNKLFQLLVPLISLPMLLIVEWLMYKPYIDWVVGPAMGCYAALYVLCAALSFWISVMCVEKPSAKSLTISTAVLTAYFVVAHVAGMAIVNAAVNNVAAYMFGTLLLDMSVAAACAVGTAKIFGLSGKKFGIIAVAASLAMTMVGMSIGTAVNAVMKPSDTETSFTANSALPDGNGQKLKVILLGGQSNASGVCHTEYLAKTSSTEKLNEYTFGYDNVLINFFDDNGSNSSNGYIVPVKINQGCAVGYFGPELGMGEKLSAAYGDETVIILKYAWGGSNLHTQWLSPSSKGETGDLYKAFISFVTTSMDYLVSKNYDAEIVAMCWMQGESDASKEYASLYETNQKNLVTDVRSELARFISDDGMFFVDAQISDSEYWKEYKAINAAKAACDNAVGNAVLLDTSALEYKKELVESPDLAHYDAQSGIKLGNMFAEAIIEKLKN